MMKSDKPLREYKKLSKGEIKKRIMDLFKQATDQPDLKKAGVLVRRAKKISLATRTTIPKELKRQMCRTCGAYLRSGKNATIRTQRGKVVIRCLECKHMTRIPYIAEKKAKREAKRIARLKIK